MKKPTRRSRYSIATIFALLLTLLASGPAQPAEATSVAAINCVGLTWNWIFEPPLGISGQSGYVWVYSDLLDNVCPYAAVNGLSAEEELLFMSGEFVAPYVGDCVHATVFMGDGEIHIFGDAIIVGSGGSNGATWQMAGAFPTPVCGFYSAPSVVNFSIEAVDTKDIQVKITP